MANLKMTRVRTKTYRGFKKVINGETYYLGEDAEQAEIRLLRLLLAMKTGEPAEGVTDAGETIHEAISRYCEHVQALAKSTRTARAWQVHTVKRFMGDMPLARLDRPTLGAWVDRMIADDGLSVQYRVNLVKSLRQFVGWLHESERLDIRDWERLFRLRGKLTNRRDRVQMISLSEFGRVYHLVKPQMKCFMLVALNCGFTQSDLATLRRDHVNIDKGRLERSRQKTGVSGSWLLWKPTIEALETHMEGEGDLAFKSRDGYPMLRMGDTKRDLIAEQWKYWNPKGKSFKTIRKLGAQMICEAADVDAAQLYLAHRGNSVAHLHYLNPVHSKLDDALQVVGERVNSVL